MSKQATDPIFCSDSSEVALEDNKISGKLPIIDLHLLHDENWEGVQIYQFFVGLYEGLSNLPNFGWTHVYGCFTLPLYHRGEIIRGQTVRVDQHDPLGGRNPGDKVYCFQL